MALEKYSVEIEENLDSPLFWPAKIYSANPTLHDFYASPDVMGNPTYDPDSVSNILSCSYSS